MQYMKKSSIWFLISLVLLVWSVSESFFVTANHSQSLPRIQATPSITPISPIYKKLDLTLEEMTLHRSSTSAKQSSAVEYADFDGDGEKDLVTLNSGLISIRYGQGKMDFANPEIISKNSIATYLATSDVNGDGITDLITASTLSNAIEVFSYSQKNKSGGLVKLQNANTGLNEVKSLVGTDLNHDGYGDAVVATDTSIAVLKGSINGLIQSTITIAPAESKITNICVDESLNRVFATDEVGQQILIWNLDTLQLSASIPIGVSVTSLALGDVNRDGITDLVATSKEGFLAVMLGESQESFSISKLFVAPMDITHIELAQANADGTTDVFVSDRAGHVFLMLGAGDGSFCNASIVSENSSSFLATITPNSDALADLVTTNEDLVQFITTQPLAVFTVTNTADTGAGSLRQALTDAAASAGPHTISFNIPQAAATGGVFSIRPATPLPKLSSGSVTIDGSSQKLFAGGGGDLNPNGPEIFIDFSTIATTDSGFQIESSNNIIKEITVVGSKGAGIKILGTVNSNIIQGCYIGIGENGATAPNGNQTGVLIQNGATNNTIGGSNISDRNIISGNKDNGIVIEGVGTSNNILINNIIGLDRTANIATGNNGNGVVIQGSASNNRIGGTNANNSNIISGNRSASKTGILISGTNTSSNIIQGNFIGTNTVLTNLGNGAEGIRIVDGAFLNTIGGATDNAANVIAFNSRNGIVVGRNPADTNTNRNQISRNSIFANTGIEIDLGDDGSTQNDAGDADIGPNNLQNKPVINNVNQTGNTVTVSGTLDTPNPQEAIIELFASFTPNLQKQQFLTETRPQTNGTFFVTINNAPTGVFTIGATATVQGNTSEFATGTTVTGQPDLIVQSVNVNPSTVQTGGTISVSFNIFNQGNASVNTATTAGIVLSTDNIINATDTLLTTVQVQQIAANSTVNLSATNLTIPQGTTSGAKFIGVIADFNNSVTESNETNNTGFGNLTVNTPPPPKPDLIVSSINLSQLSGLPGSNVTISLTIANRGAGDAAASSTQIRFSTDSVIGSGDLSLTTIPTSAIQAGQSIPITTQITIPATATPGNYFIGAAADSNLVIDESDEGNNIASVPFVISGIPDLVVESLTVNPQTVAPGNNITISFVIRNQGNGPASSALHDVLLSNDNNIRNGEDLLLISRPTGQLNAGETSSIVVTIAIPSNTSPGEKFIGVICDAGNQINEGSENNNVRSTPFSIVDLVPPTAKITKPNGGESIASGRSFDKIEWTASDNIGIASQELRLSTDGGTTFPTIIMTGIAPDVRSIQWNVPGGLDTTSARVQIIVKDGSGNQAISASASNFTLSPPPNIFPTPKLSNGKLTLVATNSNIKVGAKLRVIEGSQIEEFDLTVKPTKVVVTATTKSKPGNKLIKAVLVKGTTVTLIVVNPNGVESGPFPFLVQ